MFDEDRPYRDIVAAASRDGLQYQGVSHVINLAGATNFFDEDDSGCSARPQHVQPPHTTGYVIPPVTRPSSTTHTASPSATPHAPSVRCVRGAVAVRQMSWLRQCALPRLNRSLAVWSQKLRLPKPVEHEPWWWIEARRLLWG
jgi:hypothetical protein